MWENGLDQWNQKSNNGNPPISTIFCYHGIEIPFYWYFIPKFGNKSILLNLPSYNHTSYQYEIIIMIYFHAISITNKCLWNCTINPMAVSIDYLL